MKRAKKVGRARAGLPIRYVDRLNFARTEAIISGQQETSPEIRAKLEPCAPYQDWADYLKTDSAIGAKDNF